MIDTKAENNREGCPADDFNISLTHLAYGKKVENNREGCPADGEKYESFSPEDTASFAEKMAERAKPGDIICLRGLLGAGKTAFAQGFARGLGITGHVVSPTFTLLQEYESGRLPLYHFDLYRLADESGDTTIDPDTLDELGFCEYLYSGGVCLIEWADYARDYIPSCAVWVEISRSEEKGGNYRMINVKINREGRRVNDFLTR